jgi:hypothetical protein
MATVFELLDEIRKRPGMYVGGVDLGRLRQLQNLELLLFGYAAALRSHGIEEPVKDFVREFGQYLQERYEWSTACGPAAAIRDAATDDEDAWRMFWQLLDDFKASAKPDSRVTKAT